jgi:hypothetical protein
MPPFGNSAQPSMWMFLRWKTRPEKAEDLEAPIRKRRSQSVYICGEDKKDLSSKLVRKLGRKLPCGFLGLESAHPCKPPPVNSLGPYTQFANSLVCPLKSGPP